MGCPSVLPSHRVQWRGVRLVRSHSHRKTLSCLASGSPPWPKILSSDGYLRQESFEIHIVTASHHSLVTDQPLTRSRFPGSFSISLDSRLRCTVAAYNTCF